MKADPFAAFDHPGARVHSESVVAASHAVLHSITVAELEALCAFFPEQLRNFVEAKKQSWDYWEDSLDAVCSQVQSVRGGDATTPSRLRAASKDVASDSSSSPGPSKPLRPDPPAVLVESVEDETGGWGGGGKAGDA